MTQVVPLPERVRQAAAEASEQAQLVRIDHDALEQLAATIDPTLPEPFPEEQWAGSVDHRLWQRGQDPAVKARPRHRCRCTYY